MLISPVHYIENQFYGQKIGRIDQSDSCILYADINCYDIQIHYFELKVDGLCISSNWKQHTTLYQKRNTLHKTHPSI